jgi:hypothetical protein
MFQLHNANPKNKKSADCVVRAFSFALNKSWDTIYTELAEIGMKIKAMPNEKSVYSKYAQQSNLTQCKVELTNGKKPTVSGFAKQFKTGTYILRVANHLTVVQNGKYYDTWDCGDKSVYMYWKI